MDIMNINELRKSWYSGNGTGDLERITPASIRCAKWSYSILAAQGGHIKLDRYNALRCNNAHNELIIIKALRVPSSAIRCGISTRPIPVRHGLYPPRYSISHM